MIIDFWKMHGLGNDYVVFDNRDQKISDAYMTQFAKKICERHFSVGADGLLLVCCSQIADIKMRIFNSDGSEAEMCGNGIRCFSKYCYENDIINRKDFSVETLAGIKHVWLTLNRDEVSAVKVDMGIPNWSRTSLPMIGEDTCINDTLKVNKENYTVTCLSMGNPHCITFVDCVDDFPVGLVGPLIENNPAFPKRTNVGFVQVLNTDELKVRVWERGCGETLACGTGICAAVAASNKLGKVGSTVLVHALGGDLKVEVGDTIFMTGPVSKVFKGTLFEEL